MPTISILYYQPTDLKNLIENTCLLLLDILVYSQSHKKEDEIFQIQMHNNYLMILRFDTAAFLYSFSMQCNI